ncbi:hypothetical protein PIROE2DRAFT_56973 [Piromyces sp. E2]|nr:hypothetical protein PIROE2DRAFT_56973 [Piromyces sp. E2]|eukprot:OUM70081.1 hypothetical protein PIROE2DRAFT_56973 [Piromyces sp. E2]
MNLIIKIFFIKIFLFEIVYGSLCVYNNKGTIRYEDLTLKDINYAYSKLDYFIGNNPFNTYFGDCNNDQELVNIFGEYAKINHFTRIKRDNKNDLLNKFNLNGGNRRCNLLTGDDAEGNPYSEELTGIKNTNKVVGWKAIKLTNITIGAGNSITRAISFTFDDSYSVSLQETSSENESVTLEKNYSENQNENFSTSISQVIEESISTVMSNENGETWDNSIMNEISNTNEEHSENNWNKESNKSDSHGSNSNRDDGSNWSSSHTSGSGSTSSSGSSNSNDETNSISGGGGFTLGISSFLSFNAEANTSKSTSVTNTKESSKSKESNKSDTNERGGSWSISNGTSEDHTVGSSESNGGSKGKSKSVAISESMTKSNGGSRTVSNSIDRSKSLSDTHDKTTAKDIGFTIGNSTSTTTGKEKGTTKGKDISKSKSVNVSFDISINGRDNNFCEVVVYKKVTKIFHVVSCHDKDEKNNYSINRKSLEVSYIDFKMLEEIDKMDDIIDMKNITLKEKLGDFHSQAYHCTENVNRETFIPIENEFTRIKKKHDESGIKNSYYGSLSSYNILSPNSANGINKIKNHDDDNIATILINDLGNIILKKGQYQYLNTETSNISKNALFRISRKNHLEVFVKGEAMFGCIGTYAEEFKDVDYTINPGLNKIINDPIKKDPEDILPEPEIENKYVKHLIDDNIDASSLFDQSEEICKYTLSYCTCKCKKTSKNVEECQKENGFDKLSETFKQFETYRSKTSVCN